MDGDLEVALAGGFGESAGDEEKPASSVGGFDVTGGVHESEEEVPEVVEEKQESGGEFGGVAVAATESVESPLVFDFVEDVFGVGALAVEVDDLPRVGLGKIEIGDVGFAFVAVLIPKLSAGFFGNLSEESSSKNHATLTTPSVKLKSCFGGLQHAFLRGSLPCVFRNFRHRAADVARHFEFE